MFLQIISITHFYWKFYWNMENLITTSSILQLVSSYQSSNAALITEKLHQFFNLLNDHNFIELMKLWSFFFFLEIGKYGSPCLRWSSTPKKNSHRFQLFARTEDGVCKISPTSDSRPVSVMTTIFSVKFFSRLSVPRVVVCRPPIGVRPSLLSQIGRRDCVL